MTEQQLCKHGESCSELECVYSCSHWRKPNDPRNPASVINDFVSALIASGQKCREKVSTELDVPYSDQKDSDSQQFIDFYGLDEAPVDAPIFVFIHGGYWQEGSRKLATTMVEPSVARGAVVAAVGYDLATTCDIRELVKEVASAIKYLDRRFEARGTRGMLVLGHSAGAHLIAAALALIGDEQHQLPTLRVVLLLSGIYDIRPLVDTYIGRPIKLTMDSATSASPLLFAEKVSRGVGPVASVIAIVGEYESSVFFEQAEEMCRALRNQSGMADRVATWQLDDEDHFSEIENMDDPQQPLMRAIFAWMQM
uniref:Arylformamidase n=1 Tax=Plectus sambesii TaxID=2011161 RepID=A0A914VUC5_9BILA